MKASVKISLFFLTAAAASFVLASCGNSSPKQESGASSAESASTPSVTKVNIGTRMDYDVISYIDADSGELMGFDIDMFKLLDEALPQYEFIYDPVGQEAILMGLDAGQYQAGLGGYFYNAERAEKYLFPKYYVSGALACLEVREEDKDILTDLEALYDHGGKLVPISPISGTYGIVTTYNREHPDKAIALDTIEWQSVGNEEIATWIREGTYDANVSLKMSFESAVRNGVDFTGVTLSEPFSFVPAYTLFAKGQEAFRDDYDKALKTIIESGKASDISNKWFGFDVFAEEYLKGYVTDAEA